MASNYRGWFSAQKGDGYMSGISDADFSSFESFVEGETTASNAVNQLVSGKTIADKDRARGRAFSLVVRFAQDFPDSHPLLIDFLKELFSDPALDTTGYSWELRSIHDGLQSSIANTLSASGRQASATQDSQLCQHRQRWSNFHIFMAKCRSAGTLSVGENFAIIVAENSLETNLTPSSRLQLETHVPAAAGWLAYAAPVILAACRANAPSGWRETTADSRLWKGPGGFSIGRWEFWKQRLEEIRKEGFSDETTYLLRQAFVAMEKAQRAKVQKKI